MTTEAERREDYDAEMRRREQAHYQQALRDADACRESRRVTRATNTCHCYCCELDRRSGRGQR